MTSSRSKRAGRKPKLPSFISVRLFLRRNTKRLISLFFPIYALFALAAGMVQFALSSRLPDNHEKIQFLSFCASIFIGWLSSQWAQQVILRNGELVPFLPLTRVAVLKANLLASIPALLFVGVGLITIMLSSAVVSLIPAKPTIEYLALCCLVNLSILCASLGERIGIRWTMLLAPVRLTWHVAKRLGAFFKFPWIVMLACVPVLWIFQYGLISMLRDWLQNQGLTSLPLELLELILIPHAAALRVALDPANSQHLLLAATTALTLYCAFTISSVVLIMRKDDFSQFEAAAFEQWLEYQVELEEMESLGAQENVPAMGNAIATAHDNDAGQESSDAEFAPQPVRNGLGSVESDIPTEDPDFQLISELDTLAEKFHLLHDDYETNPKLEATIVSGYFPDEGCFKKQRIRQIAVVLIWVCGMSLVISFFPELKRYAQAAVSFLLAVALIASVVHGSDLRHVLANLRGFPARFTRVVWSHYIRSFKVLLVRDAIISATLIAVWRDNWYGIPLTMCTLQIARVTGYIFIWLRWLEHIGRRSWCFLWIVPVILVLIGAGLGLVAFPVFVLFGEIDESMSSLAVTLWILACCLAVIVWSLPFTLLHWIRNGNQIMSAPEIRS